MMLSFGRDFETKTLKTQVLIIIGLMGLLTACSPEGSLTPIVTPEFVITSSADRTNVTQITMVAEVEEGNPDIVALSADGRFFNRLTTNPSVDIAPSLSPDGQKIAFTSIRDGEANIYIMDDDGANEMRLTQSPGSNTTPSWSPNGELIAYTSTFNGKVDINIINVNTGQTFPLIIHDTSLELAAKQHPVWSPNGERIAFEGFTIDQKQSNIYSVNLDGSNLTVLAESPFDEVYPVWSPDGNRLAFSSNRDGITANTFKIYILDVESGITKRLTSGDDREVEQHPEWLPGGEQIVYISSESPNTKEIIIANVNSKTFDHIEVNGIKIVGFPQVIDSYMQIDE